VQRICINVSPKKIWNWPKHTQKMLGIISHLEKSPQIHYETSLHSSSVARIKILDMEILKSSYLASGKVLASSEYTCFGNQFSNFSIYLTWRCLMSQQFHIYVAIKIEYMCLLKNWYTNVHSSSTQK
jgi:hypothetical protein